jgi:serine/threonine-protein kinase PknK
MGAGHMAQVRTEPFLGLHEFTNVVNVASGATSQVFRARQPTMDRMVAIKVLALLVHDAGVRARFDRELTVMGRLSRHPLLITIHSHGVSATGHPYLVMPWYERGSVADELRRRGPMTVPEVLRIGVKIGAALEHAHDQGIVHRDVKPANVLLSDLGESVLADFGGAVPIQRMHAVTTTLTPIHAAPELLCGGEASWSSDVWALTSTLYTAVSGRAPFAQDGGTGGVLEEMSRLVREPMPPLPRADVPAELDALLRAGLAKEPADRPTAGELAEQLQRMQADQGLPVTEIPGAIPWPAGRASLPLPAPATAPVTPIAIVPPAALGPVEEQVAEHSEAPEEITVLRYPPAPPTARSRRASMAIVAAGALAGVGAAAGLLIGLAHVYQSGSQPVSTEKVSARTDAVGKGTAGRTVAGRTVAGNPVVVGRSATTVALSWADPNQGQARYRVIVAPPSGPETAQDADTNSAHTVRSLRPGQAYCFRVATGTGRVTPVTAQVCTRTRS